MKAEKTNNSQQLLFTLTVLAVLVSFLGAGFTYYTVNQYKNTWFTGFALQSGDINLSIQTAALINFTVDSINWGGGKVDNGQNSATLNTCCGGSVTGGNWTVVSQGFEVVNMGNVNLSLNISAGKTAAAFIGGTAGGAPWYQYNVSNKEATACNGSAGVSVATFYNLSTSSIRVCDLFRAADAADEIKIDIKLIIPSDSLTGSRTDTVTATIVQF